MNTLTNALSPQIVHIWSKSLSNCEAELDTAYNCLSNDEQFRSKRFKFTHHQHRFILTRASLRHIIARYINTCPNSVQIEIEGNGKPVLAKKHHHPLTFNLSHSGDQAIFAITLEHGIGVDIEKQKVEYNPEIAKRFFHQEEYQGIIALPKAEQASAFFRLWTRKEALVKATGQGLASHIQGINLSIKPEIERYEGQWKICPLACATGFQASLACHISTKTIAIIAGNPLSETTAMRTEIDI